MPAIEVYTRRGCHLCEELIEALLEQVNGRLELDIRDIDTRDDWREQYDTRVPVVRYDGEFVCQYHLDREALEQMLSNTTT